MPTTPVAVPELASLLEGCSAGELIPELARYGLQQLIELEASAVIGADRHERSEERVNHRNGQRPRTLTTQVGDLALQIPKLRAGSYIGLGERWGERSGGGSENSDGDVNGKQEQEERGGGCRSGGEGLR